MAMDIVFISLGIIISTILLVYIWCSRRRNSRTARDTFPEYTYDETYGEFVCESLRLAPYTLDLHGYTLAEAKKEVPLFLERKKLECAEGGSKISFIITGHGRHSPDGPKIKPMVENYLLEEKYKHKWEEHGGRVAIFLSRKQDRPKFPLRREVL
ncbi:bromodomain-containing protein [Biomphalaria glabrata]|nr:bromodomain-containing protein [Biomphalaria glabrata]